MSTYTNNMTMTAPEIARAALECAAEQFNTATEDVTLATMTTVMLAGAPLIGLLFVLALPVISVAFTLYYGAKLMACTHAARKGQAAAKTGLGGKTAAARMLKKTAQRKCPLGRERLMSGESSLNQPLGG